MEKLSEKSTSPSIPPLDFNFFSNRLSKLIESKGTSARQMAFSIGMVPSSVSRYLSGSRTPDLNYVYLISRYFGVSIDWLLGLSDSKDSSVSDDAKHVADLYSMASEADQNVIKLILNKYENSL